MSLADELIADLEDDPINENRQTISTNGNVEEMDIGENVHADSFLLTDTMSKINFYQNNVRKSGEVCGPVEQDPEYLLIVDANNLLVEIDNEINVIHKFARDIYHKRFPELEQLVQQPMDYLRTVKELGNHVEKAKHNEHLPNYLTPATIMIVSVSASTTQGADLTKDELDRVTEACDIAIKLDEHKATILKYVESRMTFIAPNLSLIVGASTAAKLMGIAGGLTNLTKMPSCNILLLGSHKKSLGGFSSTQQLPHAGCIYYSDIVQNCPADLRAKVARLVAGKVTLAARVDSFHESADGKVGDFYRSDIERRLEKLQEPPPVKAVKPLPPPIDPGRKKRGGRRARKMKERLGMTDLRRQGNRMIFGEIDEDAYQDAVGFSFGTIGKSGSGRIRAPQVDSKTKARISQKLHKTLQRQNNTFGGMTTVKKHVSGTASSVAFTPLQGLEIVNPNAADKDKTGIESQKYFSNAFGFTKISPSVIPKTT
ncbi:unnamed protein product [Didymodactylos carnosus]|uniref:U4/U6 small nuclear ribonucleoprotein Prp31 n=1 Tax=Didymodactylos carnosus TaxID=1234261 RepID=A0A814W268_9BILA|nr:unnamed protein product [Didymodactylos carnosus]CAF1311957.1 unnamed protein product [Didymodactylos carnosus]CAF3961001.1 unnamed protein product [Didymodactylos carnosus]CAF4120275.1 unnamed protein product [Didymodactylos carnosus]